MPGMPEPSWTSARVRRAIALLRAVNVGGRSVQMAALKTMVSDLGYGQPRTLLQTGNIVFDLDAGRREKAADIEQRLEHEITARAGLQSDVFVRSVAEWDDAIAANPFPNAATADPAHLVMVTLKAAPRSPAVAALRASIRGREEVTALGRHLYVVYPDGIGTSRLTGSSIERTLSTRGTARNWNTVLKLAALAHA
jgi:uncharacterized protein (DUF1697 family)